MNSNLSLLILCAMAFAHCSAPDPKKITPSSTTSVTKDECVAEDDTNTDEETALYLQDEVTFEKDIRPIVEATCATSGCHAAGGTEPTLETYQQNIDHADASIEQIEDDLMPQGNPLAQSDKDLWLAWLDGDLIEGEPVDTDSDDIGEEESDQVASEDDKSNCDVSDSSPKPTNSDLLNEVAVEDCHEKDLIYDRNLKDCGTASIDINYSCDKEGITSAFNAAGLDPTSILSQSLGDRATGEGDGFTIDQCGEALDGKPIVFLIRIQEPPETQGLKVRVLSVE